MNKMQPKLNLIAAACSTGGIGYKGDLPWRLKSEMAYFTKMTKETENTSKKNAVIMGRKTWDSIPLKYRPLADRISIVLTKQNLNLGEEAKVCNSLEAAIDLIKSSPFSDSVEKVWAAMQSPYCHRIYMTDIMKEFECDTFFPPIDKTAFQLVTDSAVPQEEQEENGIRFKYQIYEKVTG
ncbi:hypothetical protein B566_EDAN013879 [Ephemera danica]|nr:hypothetical protein B566_EDAN013879 [Ephemera danica]